MSFRLGPDTADNRRWLLRRGQWWERLGQWRESADSYRKAIETGVVDVTYSVMILNASPDEGLDEQMRDVLINNGWAADVVFASDSASQDFSTTTVYYVAEEDELAAIGLANLIGGAEVEQSDFYSDLNDTGAKQLTVVIGLDRATTAPETPADTPAP